VKEWTLQPIVLGGLAASVGHTLAAARFRRRTETLAASIRESALKEAAKGEMARADGLPAPVAAWGARAAAGGPPPAWVRLQQRGEMRLKPGDRWRPFRAVQTIGLRVPAFVWLADFQIAPLLSLRILDAFVGGQGQLEARLFGSLPLARAAGPETDRGELMRYLAELAWVPQAMSHNRWLHWREIAQDRFEVSAESPDGPARVRLRFEHGDLVEVEADDRPREEHGRMVPRPWKGRFWSYRVLDRWRIPAQAEVSWVLPEGDFPCWRGEVVSAESG
jgi:hypothetical protein